MDDREEMGEEMGEELDMDIKTKAKILQRALRARGAWHMCPDCFELEVDGEEYDRSKHDFYLVDLLDKTRTSYGSFTKGGYPVLMKLEVDFANWCQPSSPLDLKTCKKLVESIEAGVVLDQGICNGVWLKDRDCHISLDDFSWEKMAIDCDLVAGPRS